MAPVKQLGLGKVSWSVVCAACCHMTLVFAVMHLYNILEFFIASAHSFFILFFLNLVLVNRRNGPRYQRALALCDLYIYIFFFFNRGDTEGTNSSKIVCLTFVYVLLYVNLCRCQD